MPIWSEPLEWVYNFDVTAATQSDFVTSRPFVTKNVTVLVNGLWQKPVSHFTEVNTTTIRLTTPAKQGSTITVIIPNRG